MNILTLIEEGVLSRADLDYAIRLYIETRLVNKQGFDMLVGPQPMILSSSGYNHKEMESGMELRFIRGATSSEGTLLKMAIYEMSMGEEDEWNVDLVLHFIDKEINVFIDNLFSTHFVSNRLNRFSIQSITFHNYSVSIEYLIDTASSIQCNTDVIIAAHTILYAKPDVWAVRYQNVTSRQ